MKLSRDMASHKEGLDNSLRDRSSTAKRLEELENKVEENSKKLDRICEILEAMKFSQE